ncbi:MAG: hypothetical protein ISR65_06360 [Bacteriovoracaceae bacterium]|nr:hypothetical protein [Bacteriovoracaceae bacterium]
MRVSEKVFRFLPLIILLITSQTYSSDGFKQHLPHQLKDDPSLQQKAGSDEMSYTLPGSAKGYLDKEGALKSSVQPVNQKLPGTYQNSEELIEAKNYKLLTEINAKSTSAFSINYFLDSADDGKRSALFKKIFQDNEDSVSTGLLHVSMKKYFYKNTIDLSWGLAGGISFNSGKGYFVSGIESSTTFKLWMIPIDFSLGVDLPIGRWFKLGFYAGPSIMGLIQNRDDYLSDEDGKRVRQVSYGYFAGGNAQFSLSNIFSSMGIVIYNHYSASNLFLTLNARMHNYSNFQDVFSVTGFVLGVGFTLEYF